MMLGNFSDFHSAHAIIVATKSYKLNPGQLMQQTNTTIKQTMQLKFSEHSDLSHYLWLHHHLKDHTPNLKGGLCSATAP